jgi:hypothetical protein
MDEDDKQVFFAAAILLAAAIEPGHEAIDEKQIGVAVENAHKIRKAVEKHHEEASKSMPLADLSGGE